MKNYKFYQLVCLVVMLLMIGIQLSSAVFLLSNYQDYMTYLLVIPSIGFTFYCFFSSVIKFYKRYYTSQTTILNNHNNEAIEHSPSSNYNKFWRREGF